MWNAALQRKLIDTIPDAEAKALLRTLVLPYTPPPNVRAWMRQVPRLRQTLLDQVFLRGFAAAEIANAPRIVWGRVLKPDPAYRIRKLRYQIYPDYWIPALLYEPVGRRGKVPVALAPMGHAIGGKACNQAFCINLAKRGILTLSLEFIGMGELSGDRTHNNIAHLNLTGLAGVGLFYLALKKGLDLALAQPQADHKRVAVSGCSGGGWQSIMIAALDPRITLCVPVAGYTSFHRRIDVPDDVGDLEQIPPDLAALADYPTLTAMLAPRPALLILNEMDNCCYATARTRPVIYDAVKPVYEGCAAADRFLTYSNVDPGTHNYDADNRSQFYRFLNAHFGLSAPVTDIHRSTEVLTETEINVGLPERQQTLLTLALRRARKLTAARRPLRTAQERRQLRGRLTELLRLPAYDLTDRVVCRTGRLSQHLFSVGPWSVPALVQASDAAATAELWIADGGRPAMGGRSLAPDAYVCAADVFGTGESRPNNQLQMLLEHAGQRVLGVQVAQILTLAEWLRRQSGVARIRLTSDGLRTYVASLLAAALKPEWFAALTVSSPVSSLAELIEIPCGQSTDLPLFCFGLLDTADIRDLKALLDNVELLQPGRGIPPEVGHK